MFVCYMQNFTSYKAIDTIAAVSSILIIDCTYPNLIFLQFQVLIIMKKIMCSTFISEANERMYET